MVFVSPTHRESEARAKNNYFHTILILFTRFISFLFLESFHPSTSQRPTRNGWRKHRNMFYLCSCMIQPHSFSFAFYWRIVSALRDECDNFTCLPRAKRNRSRKGNARNKIKMKRKVFMRQCRLAAPHLIYDSLMQRWSPTSTLLPVNIFNLERY